MNVNHKHRNMNKEDIEKIKDSRLKSLLLRINAPTQKVKCFRCGKELEIPNPPIKVLESWGCMAKTVFVVANLLDNGWHIRNRGITDNHPYFCPDCWDCKDEEYHKLRGSDEWVRKGKNWLKEMEEKV